MIPGRGERAVDVPDTDLRQKLRLARSISNFVVVYIHWGSEFLDWPETKQRQAADWLIKNGADIIVGHHPHLVQKPACLHGKTIFLFPRKSRFRPEISVDDGKVCWRTAASAVNPYRAPASSREPLRGLRCRSSAEQMQRRKRSCSGCAFEAFTISERERHYAQA